MMTSYDNTASRVAAMLRESAASERARVAHEDGRSWSAVAYRRMLRASARVLDDLAAEQEELARAFDNREGVPQVDPTPERERMPMTRRPCMIEGCERMTHARDRCPAHYSEWWREQRDAERMSVDDDEPCSCGDPKCGALVTLREHA